MARGGEKKRSDRLVGDAETSKELAEWRRLQGKNLNILSMPKRKEWLQCHKGSGEYSVTKYVRAAFAI